MHIAHLNWVALAYFTWRENIWMRSLCIVPIALFFVYIIFLIPVVAPINYNSKFERVYQANKLNNFILRLGCLLNWFNWPNVKFIHQIEYTNFLSLSTRFQCPNNGVSVFGFQREKCSKHQMPVAVVIEFDERQEFTNKIIEIAGGGAGAVSGVIYTRLESVFFPSIHFGYNWYTYHSNWNSMLCKYWRSYEWYGVQPTRFCHSVHTHLRKNSNDLHCACLSCFQLEGAQSAHIYTPEVTVKI